MNVLIISNEYPNNNRISNPIIERIIHSTAKNADIGSVRFFPFQNKVKNLFGIRKVVKTDGVDIVHIHFGGLYALIIWFFLLGIKIPKVITFHGTDLHAGELSTTVSILKRIKIRLNRLASLISVIAFDRIGVVTDHLVEFIPKSIYSHSLNKIFVQHLGVDFELFKEKDVTEAQRDLGIPEGKYLLFSDKSNTPIKRRDLAEKIMSYLSTEKYRLLIMSGVRPEMVPDYINASDGILITSDMEGSPNIVREALSLNKRVFSVDVGDVKEQIENLRNSCIISRNPLEAANGIKECLLLPYTDDTRNELRARLDMDVLTKDVVDIYAKLIK